MDQQKRTLLAIGLMLGLTLVYTTFLAPQPPPPGTDGADGGVALAVEAGVDAVPAVVAAPVPAPAVDAADGGAAVVAAAPVQLPQVTKEISRPELNAELTSDGAGLTSALLLGKRERVQVPVGLSQGVQMLFGKKFPPPPQMNMARPVPGQPVPFAVSIGGASPLPASLRYEVVEATADQVRFLGRSGVWEVEKTFSFGARPYEFKLDVSVKNTAATAQTGELTMHNGRAIDPAHEEAPSFFGSIGNQASLVCQVGEELHRKLPGDDDKAHEDFAGTVAFGGIDQQYFFSAIYPVGGAKEGKCKTVATLTARQVDVVMPLSVAPNETLKLAFGGFIGPKDLQLLERVGVPDSGGGPQLGAVAPRLDRSVDFGWWAAICQVLLKVMTWFHDITGNWGVAIILLTVSAKLVLLPLTHKAMLSAENMKKLQPKMEEIRQKYADDKEKQNLETMKLYQSEKVNPLGGCLPLLVQLPIWAALFTTLRTSYDLYGAPFVGPVWTDMTMKDPTYILPLALGVTMFITQKLQPQMMDPAQAKMFLYFMPIFFTVIMLAYPAGLSLYIFTNNLLSIAQQFALRRYLKARGLAAPDPPKRLDAKK
jgi:YidC/Oxa1 family membrane protein insertase